MTIFGYDVSEHQGDFDHQKAYDEGYRFVIARTSQGATYEDKKFRRNYKAIRKTPLLFAAYHRLGTTPPVAQAKTVAGQIRNKKIPIFLDSETGGGNEAMNYQVAAELQKLGYRVIGNYFPEWYWSQIGKPSLRIGPLWSSKYVSGTGTGAALYGKMPKSYWDGYGGQKVRIVQFSESTKIAGQLVDANAFEGSMAELTDLFNGSQGKKPEPAPVVTTLAGTRVNMPPMNDAIRQPFRDRLTNTAGKYPGCACDCMPRYIALVEALAQEAGIEVPLQFWEGCWIVTPNSGQTHAGGGAFDININRLTGKQTTALVKICRMAGGAAWLRNLVHGGFLTPHIHVEIIGCEHASPDARSQWDDYKNGRDGLRYHGPDYGPKVKYITADKAFGKLTRTTKQDPTSKEASFLDMKALKTMKRSKAQTVKNDGKYKCLRLEDSGDVSWAFGPGTYRVTARVVFSNATPGDELMIRAAYDDTDKKTGKTVKSSNGLVVGLDGGSGNSYREFEYWMTVGAPAKGRTRRLRIRVANFGATPIHISSVTTRAWKA